MGRRVWGKCLRGEDQALPDGRAMCATVHLFWRPAYPLFLLLLAAVLLSVVMLCFHLEHMLLLQLLHCVPPLAPVSRCA